MFRIKEEKDIGYGLGHFSPSASQLEGCTEEMRKRIYEKMEESLYGSRMFELWGSPDDDDD